MARRPRVHYEGALYHVIARGNNKEYIFKENKWKREYLNTLMKYKKKFGFNLYSYCIMDNHVHLLIEVGKIPLSKIMQCIQQVHTQKFNWAEKRTGHLFEQRYKAYLCDKDNYLLQIVKYIHQNPQRAEIVNGINYEWSSHDSYINGKPSELIDKEFILGLLSSDKVKAVKYYIELMESTEEIDILETKMEEEQLYEKIVVESDQLDRELISIEKLIKDLIELEQEDIENIRRKSRKKRYSDIRKAIILLSVEYTDTKNKDLSEKLNLSQSMISKIRMREVIIDEDVMKIMERYRNRSG